ncbi:MAG: DUF2169 domain-containing protein [Deltaproteobacteria bacterium]|nr:DUF2169 domain-containing protein [Deltaproteobacteria bacterium]
MAAPTDPLLRTVRIGEQSSAGEPAAEPPLPPRDALLGTLGIEPGTPAPRAALPFEPSRRPGEPPPPAAVEIAPARDALGATAELAPAPLAAPPTLAFAPPQPEPRAQLRAAVAEPPVPPVGGTIDIRFAPAARRPVAPFPLAPSQAALGAQRPVLRPAPLPGAPWSAVPAALVPLLPAEPLLATAELPARAEVRSPQPSAPEPRAFPREEPPRKSDAVPVVNLTPLAVASLSWQIRPPQDALVVVCKGTFDLVPDGPAVLRAQGDLLDGDLLPDGRPDLKGDRSIAYASDFAIHKQRADVTLVGKAYAPGGKAARVDVRFRFGEPEAGSKDGARRGFDRRLVVFGERRWEKSRLRYRAPPPAPFAEMPLDYEHAFGGPGYAPNPVGIGYRGPDVAPAGLALPNVEHAAGPIEGPDDMPPPACFAPVPGLWRMRRAAARDGDEPRYGPRWRASRWPYLPEGFDRTELQAATPPQQLAFLRGDEPYAVEGMRPEGAAMRGALPALRARLFAHRTGKAKSGAAEPGGEGQAQELREIPLCLDTAAFDLEQGKLNLVWRGSIDVSDERASEIEALYVSIEPLAAEPLPLEQVRAQYLAARGALPVVAEGPGAPAAQPDLARAGWAGEPPPADPAAMAAQLRRAGASEADVAALVGSFGRGAGPVAPAVPAAPAAAPGGKRAEVCRRLGAREGLAGLDLCGVDLSGLDLAGRALAGLAMKGARMCGWRLAGADLSEAQLGGADLSDAVLDGARLDRADLHGAKLQRASLAGASLAGASLAGADGRGADLHGATGAGASFSEGRWQGTRFADADLPECNFSAAVLDGAQFDRARLREIRLYDAAGTAVSFAEADLTAARADDAFLPGSSFARAAAPGSVWAGARLEGASFERARLRGASFERARLGGAVLARADLREGRLRGAVLAQASLPKANLMMACLHGADLRDADLRGANLYAAETWKADLSSAKLAGAIVAASKLDAPEADNGEQGR